MCLVFLYFLDVQALVNTFRTVQVWYETAEKWARYGISKFGWPPHPAPETAGDVQNATFEVAPQFEFSPVCFELW